MRKFSAFDSLQQAANAIKVKYLVRLWFCKCKGFAERYLAKMLKNIDNLFYLDFLDCQ